MASTSLKVLMPPGDGQRWSCHSCGRCCYDLVGHISKEECRRIDRQGWGDSLGAPAYLRLGRAWVLNKRDNGACVFLDESTHRCRIHEKFGEQAKPRACRIYPFTVRDVPEGWQASLRFDCPSVAGSVGAVVEDYASLVRELTHGLRHEGATGDDCPEIQTGLRASEAETRMIVARFAGWLGDRSYDLTTRVVAAAEATQLLAGAKYEAVREERFGELIDLLLGVRPGRSQGDASAAAPTPKQRAMLRELAYVHAAHVSIEESRAALVPRMRGRLAQLGAARRFRVGKGAIPDVRGLFDPRSASEPRGSRLSAGRSARAESRRADALPPVESGDPPFEDRRVDRTVHARQVPRPSFEDAESVLPADDPDQLERIDDLVTRYLRHRLVTRGAFGYGYYRWPLFAGLGALWAATAAIGWLARVQAAWGGRAVLTFDDVFEGLRIVDRSAGRSPALGTRAERLRLRVMEADDGLAKLLLRYALVGENARGT
ncbi:MAG: YkgJ family cysteine cluster protein [Phycisphaerales bacterium]|nr:MAG: YkgJ family cysteine cluster protein [Phycisphaerales bacterium]